ncbi:MAG: S-methyl-5-thioribose-1-phosphate isomerase [Trichodesmium sp. St4_bin8_1]|nr:S-methyl-5-thioribose-1-phosphate isomerase [Trichodesmium sp. St4_bin8_1]
MTYKFRKVNPITWKNDHVLLIDQTSLPEEYKVVEISSYEEMAIAIKTMIVRGAPAIGVSAAYGMYLGARETLTNDRNEFLKQLEEIAVIFRRTRPTAVNLFWAIERILKVANETNGTVKEIQEAVLKAAKKIHQEDLETCKNIGDRAVEILPTKPEKLNILTHCNAGALATAGYGTALGVIRSAWRDGRLGKVYADETRPRLQGAKLTTWECVQENIPVTLISDNMAAHCMKQGLIHAVVVGADRIAANGDTANKIGTYSLAIVSQAHNIPLYVAAPLSTIDFKISDGSEIPIEERDTKEIYQVGETRICPKQVEFYNPAFDVTPAELITGIMTEHGTVLPGELEQFRVKQLV